MYSIVSFLIFQNVSILFFPIDCSLVMAQEVLQVQ